MKIRSGFVSNSSSSSFIVIGKKPPESIASVELDKETAQRVISSLDKKVNWDGKKAVFLTQFLLEDVTPFLKGYHYSSGDLGCFPYNDYDLEECSSGCSCEKPNTESIWVILSENEDDPTSSVWIQRQHVDAFFNERRFVEEVRKSAASFGILNYVLEIKHEEIKKNKIKKAVKKATKKR